MPLIDAAHTLRIARPSRSLAAAQRFWCEGVGLDVLWRTGPEAQGGHALLMLGLSDASWHLELVEDPQAARQNPPGPEDLLVLYRGRPLESEALARLERSGGRRVPARNPYWDEYGTTIQDPDGYLLVLSHRTWG